MSLGLLDARCRGPPQSLKALSGCHLSMPVPKRPRRKSRGQKAKMRGTHSIPDRTRASIVGSPNQTIIPQLLPTIGSRVAGEGAAQCTQTNRHAISTACVMSHLRHLTFTHNISPHEKRKLTLWCMSDSSHFFTSIVLCDTCDMCDMLKRQAESAGKKRKPSPTHVRRGGSFYFLLFCVTRVTCT